MGGRRDCVTVLHNTICTALSPSLSSSNRETEQSEQEGEHGGFKRVLVLMRAMRGDVRLAGKSYFITVLLLIMPVMRSCLGGEGTRNADPWLVLD